MKTLLITLTLLLSNKHFAQQISQQDFLTNNNTVAVQSYQTPVSNIGFDTVNSGTGRTKEEEIKKSIIKPFEFSSLKKALKSLKYEEVLVVVNQSDKQEYQNFVALYSNGLDNVHTNQTPFKFYFANAKDAYLIKKLKLQNGVGFVNKYRDVIYRDTNGIETTSSNFYYLSDKYTEIEKLHYLKLLDNEVKQSKLSENQLIKLLSKVREFAYDLPKYGFGVEGSSISEVNNTTQYKLKATPKQVTKLISSLINKHKKDISLDYEFTNFLLEGYITNNNLFKVMENKDANVLTDLDFKAINYIAWFSKDIEKELKKNSTNVSPSAKNYMSSVINLFTSATNTADYPKEIQSVISDFLTAKYNNPDLMNVYIDNLKNDRPEMMVEFFDEYYANTFKNTINIAQHFDMLFEDAVTSHNKVVFRQQFSQTCNKVAKKVYEDNNEQFFK